MLKLMSVKLLHRQHSRWHITWQFILYKRRSVCTRCRKPIVGRAFLHARITPECRYSEATSRH